MQRVLQGDISLRKGKISDAFKCEWRRAVLAEAILQQLLEGCGDSLDVSVASASVGPAPPGTACSKIGLNYS